MSEKESGTDHTKNLKKDLREYIEKRVELFSLTILGEISQLISQGVQRVVGLLLLSGAVLFAWFAFAFLLSEWLNSMSAGFAISSVPLFIFAILFVKTKSDKVTERIQASIIDRALRSMENRSENGQENQTEDE